MFRLSRRNINRLAVLALLAAPIIYLFGGLFTGLVGAHGSIVYANPVEDGYDMSVEIDGQQYERWCFYGNDAYCIFDDYTYDLIDSYIYCSKFGIIPGFFNNGCPVDFYTNIPVLSGSFFGFFEGNAFYFDSTTNENYFSCCWTSYSDDEFFVSFEAWYDGSSIQFFAFEICWQTDHWSFSYDDNTGYVGQFDVTPQYVFFGDDFSVFIPTVAVYDDSFYELLNSYRKAPIVPPKKYSPALASSPSLNSEYVFGQFFQHDNFLTKMGRDVSASANPPYGFAPVGMFINYVDANMLHFYPTDNGMGLFFYGYFYWCAHVLLLDFAFFGVTFVIRVLKRVMERLEGD